MDNFNRLKTFSIFCTMSYQEFLRKPWIPSWDAHPRADVATNFGLECVIVEPRCHDNLPFVLANVSHMLPNAALTLFHSPQNQTMLERIVWPQGPNNIRLIPIPSVYGDNMTHHDYNTLLTSPEFWDQLHAPKVLIFQTDTGIRKNDILRYYEYDYIGAPWSWTVAGQNNIHIGNGGFSLRSRSWMKEICTLKTRDDTYTDKTTGEPEDIFYARHLIYCDDVKLPSFDVANDFAVEHNFSDDPMGFHKAYDFHNTEIVQQWFNHGLDITPKNIRISDAWIECQNGLVLNVPHLTSWLSLGISQSAFRIAKNTEIAPYAQVPDPCPTYQKVLKCVVELEDRKSLVSIPIRHKRAEFEFMLL